MSDNSIFIGKSTKREELFLGMANRHGLVTGATGTGKTVTLADHGRGLLPMPACRSSPPT